MAITVQFDHHATIEDVSYIPGMIASLPELTVQPLIFAGRVHVVDQNAPVSAPGVPTGSDPYPQYLLPSELENALPGRLSQASLNATFAAMLANYTPTNIGGSTGGGGGTTVVNGVVVDNLDGTGLATPGGVATVTDSDDGSAYADGFSENADNGDGTAFLSGTTVVGGGGTSGLSSTDADALVTRAFELSVAYMRDYFAGA